MNFSSRPLLFNDVQGDCPHCGVFATFAWSALFEPDESPADAPPADAPPADAPPADAQAIASASGYRALRQRIPDEPDDFSKGRCSKCKGVTVWIGKDLWYPFRILNNESERALNAAGRALPSGVKEMIDNAMGASAAAPAATSAMLRQAVYEMCEALGFTPAPSITLAQNTLKPMSVYVISTICGNYVDFLDSQFVGDALLHQCITAGCREQGQPQGAPLPPGMIQRATSHRSEKQVIVSLLTLIGALATKLATELATELATPPTTT